MRKIFILCILILCIPFCLTGCYDATSIEKYHYAVALAIDSSEKSNIKLSLQVATSGDSGSSTSQSTTAQIFSVDCETIDVGINIINNYLSKKINLSHCSALIFSEEIAKKGIGTYINTLANNPQIRPTANILISNTNAIEVLENVSNSGETYSSRYYEFVINSTDYTGYAPNSELGRFFYNINNKLEPATANHIIVEDNILRHNSLKLSSLIFSYLMRN